MYVNLTMQFLQQRLKDTVLRTVSSGYLHKGSPRPANNNDDDDDHDDHIDKSSRLFSMSNPWEPILDKDSQF